MAGRPLVAPGNRGTLRRAPTGLHTASTPTLSSLQKQPQGLQTLTGQDVRAGVLEDAHTRWSTVSCEDGLCRGRDLSQLGGSRGGDAGLIASSGGWRRLLCPGAPTQSPGPAYGQARPGTLDVSYPPPGAPRPRRSASPRPPRPWRRCPALGPARARAATCSGATTSSCGWPWSCRRRSRRSGGGARARRRRSWSASCGSR